MKVLKGIALNIKYLLQILAECLLNVFKIVSVFLFWSLFYITRLLTYPFRLCFAPKDMDGMSGLDFERFSAKWLALEGYRSIKNTDIGADYGIDILAVKDGVKFGIQCKRYNKSVGVSAVQEVTAGLSYYECDKGIVMTNSDFTKNAIDLAAANGVDLIDGSVLKNSRAAESILENIYLIYIGIFLTAIMLIGSIILDFIIFKNAFAFLPLSLLLTIICLISLSNGIITINDRKKDIREETADAAQKK